MEHYDIFISYSRRDKDKVYTFVEEMEKHIGQKCWMDLDCIQSGEQFEDIIINALDKCQIVLFMLSDNSLESKWTKREVYYAEDEGKRIVPILVSGEKLRGWFKFHFGNVDYININSTTQTRKLFNDLCSWLGIQDVKGNGNHKQTEQSLVKNTQTIASTERKYKIGQKITINGTRGFVFEITDGGKHGKAVSMQETTASWCVKNDIDITVGAASDTNGYINTSIIQELPLWEKRFPAFSWCKSLGKDWYLPAIEEVEKFTQHHFHNNSYNIERYWSSTEKDDKTAYFKFITGGYPYPGSKARNRYVRAVAVF